MRLEIEIPDTSGLVTKTNFDTKVIQIESIDTRYRYLSYETYVNTKVTDIESKIADDDSLVTETNLQRVF